MSILKDSVLNDTYNDGTKSIDVAIQDQTSEVIDLYMCYTQGTTSPISPISIGDTSIDVASDTGLVIGGCINITENGRTMQAIAQSLVGSTVTFNTPSEQAFTTNAVICYGRWDMNRVASKESPLIFTVSPPAGVTWDITRVIFGITDQSSMDDAKFGGIPALTNGLVLRVRGGYTKNIFVVSDNGGFKERNYDGTYSDKAPAGFYGFSSRRTFAGQNKNGVVIRLNGDDGDELQVYIQDDLSDLDKCTCVAQGHVVE